MTRLFVVRHGETAWNAERRFQGSIDIPLNEIGREQARKRGLELSSISFAGIYSSHLSRAIETAELIGKKTPITFPELAETAFGEMEGQTIDLFQSRYADRIARHQTLPKAEKLHFPLVPGAESPYEVLERVMPVLRNLAYKHKDENVLIVTHGGVIKNLLIHYGDIEDANPKIANTQVTIFQYDFAKETISRFPEEMDLKGPH